MKIAEISELEQKQIDEAPAGMLKQLGRNIGAAAAGAIGMKNTAANLKGKAEVGKTANDVFTKFNKYLGTQQKSVKTATGDDLANFLQNTYNYNQAQIPQGTLNKKQIYDIINKMASDGYAQMGKGGGAGGQSAGGGTAQATQGGASGGQASGGQQGAGGTAQGTAQGGATGQQGAAQGGATGQQGGATGQQGAAQGGGKSPAGKKATGGTAAKPAAQAGAKQAASGATEIPPNVQKMLDTLSATEKQALVGMLK